MIDRGDGDQVDGDRVDGDRENKLARRANNVINFLLRIRITPQNVRDKVLEVQRGLRLAFDHL